MNAQLADIWIKTGVRETHRATPSIYTFDTLAASAGAHAATVAEQTAKLPYWQAVEIAWAFGERFAADIITHGEVDADALLKDIMK